MEFRGTVSWIALSEIFSRVLFEGALTVEFRSDFVRDARARLEHYRLAFNISNLTPVTMVSH